MANPEHVELLRSSVSEWNSWREQNLDIRTGDLTGADLRGAHLRGADLRGADLIGAQFHGTIF